MKWDSLTSLNASATNMFSDSSKQTFDIYRDASVLMENEDDLLSAQPSVPNVRTFTLPLLGRVQVNIIDFLKLHSRLP